MKPKYIKQLQNTSRDLRVVALSPVKLVVESKSDPLNSHIVQVAYPADGDVRTTCTCEWSQFNGVACAHTMAALEFLAEQNGRTLSFWQDEAAARRQKRRVFRLAHAASPDERVYITSRRARDD